MRNEGAPFCYSEMALLEDNKNVQNVTGSFPCEKDLHALSNMKVIRNNGSSDYSILFLFTYSRITCTELAG